MHHGARSDGKTWCTTLALETYVRALVASIAKIACSTLLIRKIELRIKTEVEWTRWYFYSYRPRHLLINQVIEACGGTIEDIN